MIPLQQRMKAFSELGKMLLTYSENGSPESFESIINKSYEHNNWFTRENVIFSVKSIASMLQEEKLQQWISTYSLPEAGKQKPNNVLVVMAGNIPLVGFHDFLSVLISGNNFIGKLSSDDNILLPAITEMLVSIEPSFAERIHFIEGKAEGFDAVIATGSDNSSRYFEYYFGKYPHIIRRNRSSMAVLTGQESEADLLGLADDICLYFGLGCRSVSKVFIPEDYNIRSLFPAIQKYSSILSMHNKYMNNYDYNKSIFLLNKTKNIDNGFMLFTENTALSSPVSVLNYQQYNNIEEVKKYILSEKDKLQCVAGKESIMENITPLGKSQQPELWDYADGVDTMKFLLRITK
ncbi:MAG: acyl-CoA reductase [Bacteroidota bacterium]